MGAFLLLGLLGTVGLAAFVIDAVDDDDDDDDTITDETGDGSDTTGNDLLGDDLTVIDGTDGADSIDGSLTGDQISGLGGDDSISASGGGDEVFAGDGADLVLGGNASDVLWGGVGDDVVIGGAGDDLIQGNADDDVLVGIDLGFNSQTAAELALAETDGNAGTLPAAGADQHGEDTLLGGSGDDDLFLGGGDSATGGLGVDAFVLGDWIAPDTVATINDFDAATETLSFIYTETADPAPEVTITEDETGNATINIDGTPTAVLVSPLGTVTADNVTLVARPGPEDTGGSTDEPQDPRLGDDLNIIEGTDEADLFGTSGRGDQILGLGGDDTIGAQGGRDEVFASVGDDLVSGGNGSDVVWGGPGDDTLLGGNGGDLLRGTAGNDLIFGVELGFENAFSGAIAAALPDTAPELPSSYDLPRTVVEDGQWRDVLEGGSGDDALVLGARDTGTGGLGDDGFWIGEWGQGGDGAALITDYNPIEDQILYVHSAASDAAPLPVLSFGTTEAGDGTVLADGELVAVVANAGGSLSSADVAIVTRIVAAT